jgi:hypothetical protein
MKQEPQSGNKKKPITNKKRYYHKPKPKTVKKVVEPIISRKEYILKNFWFPLIVLGGMSITLFILALLGEFGGWIIFSFLVACISLMLYLANKSYNRYKDFFNK